MIRRAAVSWCVWAFAYRIRNGRVAPIYLLPDFVLRVSLTPHGNEVPASKYAMFIELANRNLGNMTLRQYWDAYRSMYCLLGWMTPEELSYAEKLMNKYYLNNQPQALENQ
jgi:hypothetical protein